MSIGSERVKTTRQKRKDLMVLIMGGKCVICGYNKCPDSLAFHHLIPEEKEFSLGKIRADNTAWELAKLELKKCILLCHTCHSEVHAGLHNDKHLVSSFNEEYSNIKLSDWDPKIGFKPPAELRYCQYCEKILTTADQVKFCSLSCASSARKVIDIGLTKEELQELIDKGTPWTQLGKIFGMSDNGIKKRAKSMGCIIPVRRKCK